jgi:hypothetical protein
MPSTLLKNQILYCVRSVSDFATDKGLSVKEAFDYLRRYQGLHFLVECYDAEHTLSRQDTMDDLTRLCRANGGGIA